MADVHTRIDNNNNIIIINYQKRERADRRRGGYRLPNRRGGPSSVVCVNIRHNDRLLIRSSLLFRCRQVPIAAAFKLISNFLFVRSQAAGTSTYEIYGISEPGTRRGLLVRHQYFV